ncbi:Sua5/YciO/YrdC/YwlC family protein [Luteimonas vadosa]|uniref:Threonylcarbamoyl-AMP synthase n=1 Tax=Luteimonas vadosa TaxID=1165507 RepID=A0ABP9DV63_9GAMM
MVAYPTEAVWGLGCDPFDEAAVRRLLALKDREIDKGLILVAAERAQLDGLVDWDALDAARREAVHASWPGPHTWIAPCTARVPPWITGTHAGVAVRVSAHPVVVALCRGFGGPIVSTSANPAGLPPPRRREDMDTRLAGEVDAIVEGETGDLGQPTPIRIATDGRVLRG